MVIADTGFWLALTNRRDHLHSQAIEALQQLEEPLISTWPVLTETCHLLLHRIGTFAMLRFMRSVMDGSVAVFSLPEETYPRIYALMRKYKDLPMDLADASLIILAEQLGHGRILSTDVRDFHSYRWKNTKPFQNLLEVK